MHHSQVTLPQLITDHLEARKSILAKIKELEDSIYWGGKIASTQPVNFKLRMQEYIIFAQNEILNLTKYLHKLEVSEITDPNFPR